MAAKASGNLFLKMIDEAQGEFEKRLRGHAPILIDKDDCVIDDEAHSLVKMFSEVADHFQKEKGYTLKAIQQINAFFAAARKLDLLKHE